MNLLNKNTIAELEKRDLVETFIENGIILQNKGFKLDVFCVYHPSLIDNLGVAT